ncbi:MAG: LysR family transcriptional regulator [Gammaproteobacteria bacterium]|nr:LysR family transcriptional regulator [Gammaproteobacteria bacterium]
MIDLNDAVLFSKLAELKSFTAVAEQLQISRSLVSKRITRLEDQLGVQLLSRSTRRLELTEAGTTFFAYCGQIEQKLLEAEMAVSEIREHPRGTLKVNAPVTLAQLVLTPLISKFLTLYSRIGVELSVSDKQVDVIEGGYDVVIRIARLKDSNLKARKLADTRLVTFAHRSYIEKHGLPDQPQDLLNHNCLTYRFMGGSTNEWSYQGKRGMESVRVSGNFNADNGIPLVRAAQSGLGIAVQPQYVLDVIADEELQILLTDFPMTELGIYALYPTVRKIPLKTRLFIDFLVENLNIGVARSYKKMELVSS